MNITTQSHWEEMQTPETRKVEEHLRQAFPRTDAYRFNSASIRIRVIDPQFKGKSTEERDRLVEPLLDQLAPETQADIMNLLTLYPNETEDSIRAMILNAEFENPSPSEL